MSLLDKLKSLFGWQPTEEAIAFKEALKQAKLSRQQRQATAAWFLARMDQEGLNWSSHPDLEDLEPIFDYGLLDSEKLEALLDVVLDDIASGADELKWWNRKLDDALWTLEEVLDETPLAFADDYRHITLRKALQQLRSDAPTESSTTDETSAAKDRRDS